VENRLIEAENGAWGTSTYLYDPLGERKQKVVGVNTAAPMATDFMLAGGEEIATTLNLRRPGGWSGRV